MISKSMPYNENDRFKDFIQIGKISAPGTPETEGGTLTHSTRKNSVVVGNGRSTSKADGHISLLS